MLENQYLGFFITSLTKKVCTAVFVSSFNSIKVILAPGGHLSFVRILSKDFCLGYSVFVDLWCTDYFRKFPNARFELSYRFRSLLHLSTDVTCLMHIGKGGCDSLYSVESISDLFRGAAWPEREVWDLYGVFFFNNSDLRRILTDYGFVGYPFRKDFPIFGYIEVRYEEAESNLVAEPVRLAQDFRNFYKETPAWGFQKFL